MSMKNLSTLCYLERDGAYLMLHRTVKKNDVNKDKWIGVGGHFEEGESPEECVLREVLEETGREILGAPEYVGVSHEHRRGMVADILEMDSHYFLCRVGGYEAPLRLDGYEAEQHFAPVWISPKDAIAANRALDMEANPWLEREVLVLEALIDNGLIHPGMSSDG